MFCFGRNESQEHWSCISGKDSSEVATAAAITVRNSLCVHHREGFQDKSVTLLTQMIRERQSSQATLGVNHVVVKRAPPSL